MFREPLFLNETVKASVNAVHTVLNPSEWMGAFRQQFSRLLSVGVQTHAYARRPLTPPNYVNFDDWKDLQKKAKHTTVDTDSAQQTDPRGQEKDNLDEVTGVNSDDQASQSRVEASNLNFNASEKHQSSKTEHSELKESATGHRSRVAYVSYDDWVTQQKRDKLKHNTAAIHPGQEDRNQNTAPKRPLTGNSRVVYGKYF